jgi:hypothetical protein
MGGQRQTIPVVCMMILCCLVPLLGSIFLLVFWPTKAKPIDDRDLKPERLGLAQKDSAFFILQEGAQRLRWPQENRPQIAGMAENNPRWPWNPDLARNLMASNQAVLGVIEQVLAVGRIEVPAPKTIDDDYSYLSGWGGITMLVSIQSALLFRDGHEQEALDLACKLVDLGHLFENSGGVEYHYRRDALVPEYFDHVPADDFDGKPFRYSRAKRIVYSVERDLVDDGGQKSESGKKTYDLVFELGF